ncbi:hypothetical protein DFH07DRAFT_785866 [Mycena maculata]|uniref:Uncharacterized protein n=1 Tax=Mycena maculata TaxID=230809 RepID=A0AAD7H7D4_9AGAR|nr:hypothetical protein DFH07DRAFT_785866 [Mycena maculata]
MRLSVSSIILAALFANSYALPAPPEINEVPVSASSPSSVPSVLTQYLYHATCADTANEIQTKLKSKEFTLLPGVSGVGKPARQWPDEYTWSGDYVMIARRTACSLGTGGFYLTPIEKDAQTFGAAWRAHCNIGRGGVVIIKFSLDVAGKPKASTPGPLQVLDVGTNPTVAEAFRSKQFEFGTQMRHYLEPAVGPGDQMQLPTDAKITQAKTATNVISDWTPYTAIEGKDVVMAAAHLMSHQQESMNEFRQLGIPPLSDPFLQVVLITDKALGRLTASTVPQADWYNSRQTTHARGEFEILGWADHGIKVAVHFQSILEYTPRMGNF